MSTLVLTVIGDDQSGLVDALASVITRHGGNWDRSSMATLGTKFAGIVEVTVPASQVDDLTDDLGHLESEGLLDITIERAGDQVGASDDASPAITLELRLVGQDRPGIVHEIAHALAESRVSIEELSTTTASAPMSAEQLFEATARLRAPATVDQAQLAESLEALANELMVELDLSPDIASGPGGP